MQKLIFIKKKNTEIFQKKKAKNISVIGPDIYMYIFFSNGLRALYTFSE